MGDGQTTEPEAYPHNERQLRINACRVQLTRVRDATVVFILPLAEFAETFAYPS